MSKTIEYSDNARSKLLSGVKKIAKAVKGTLGPSGKNVLIRNASDTKPFVTKDGVTVAAQIWSKDFIEQSAIELIQDAANNSDNKAGDGTTTATVLAEAIFELGSIATISDTNVIDLKKGIDKAVRFVVEELKKHAIDCHKDYDKLKDVALISSNNDEQIADVVLDAYKVAGDQGVVNIKRSHTTDTYLTTIKGMNISTGYKSVYFVNDFENQTVEFENPYIYMTNEKISKVSDNFDALLQAIGKDQHSLLILCKDMDPQILGMLVENVTKGVLKVCVCKAPGFGEQQNEELDDIGTMLGYPPFMENSGRTLESLEIDDEITILDLLPQSEGVMVTKNRLSIKGPCDISPKQKEEIEKRKLKKSDVLREQVKKQTTTYEKAVLQSRISRLSDGIAYINIGAVTDIEYDEKQHRIQDALYAVKSASEEGILPGGGTALLYISQENLIAQNRFEQIGINVLMKAIEKPFFQILENVGIELKALQIKRYKTHFNQGINARDGVHVGDMIAEGIIDPLKVVRVALENAASISGMLLTSDCVIIDESVYDKNLQKSPYE
jgi:chaperonin GroEL